MLDKETKAWLAGIFDKENLNVEEIHQRCHEIVQANLRYEMELLYELAQASADAAFYLMQLLSQNEIAALVPADYSTDCYFAISSLFPFIPAKKYIALNSHNAFRDCNVEVIDQPQAFRLFQWGRLLINSASDKIFSLNISSVESKMLMMRAAIVAGLMKKSYDLSYTFTFERSQGGRLIKDWSLIQQSLADLYLQIKVNEKLIHHLTIETALAVLKVSDKFESQCMQIMGGAGYTADFLVEKHFREIHFLKNWPGSFSESLHRYYKEQVMTL